MFGFTKKSFCRYAPVIVTHKRAIDRIIELFLILKSKGVPSKFESKKGIWFLIRYISQRLTTFLLAKVCLFTIEVYGINAGN